MGLPNLSNSMYVARLRYIQTIHEPEDCRNPDTLVRHFIPMLERWRTAFLSRKRLSALRESPFYYYLIARTKYYDQVIQEAIAAGVNQIIGIGCGSDTRAYRFDEVLCRKGIRVLECDQADSITAKQRMAGKWRRSDHVDYMPIDLNDDAWPALEQRLESTKQLKTLLMMEGVSPYINEINFCKFLKLLASRLSIGSQFAYDFKIRSVNDGFGGDGRTRKPFRLPSTRKDVIGFHEDLGFKLDHFELSSELSTRSIPGLATSGAKLFCEDALVRLTVGRS